MKIIKQVRAPVRIDFAGGTTDISPFKDKYGGAVLNAAINKYIIGKLVATNKNVGLEYHGDIPTSSGLGTSGVMNLVWLALISKTKNKQEIVEKVYDLEQVMGMVGGEQDQYAGALGGINFLEFKKDKVKVTRLNLPRRTIKKLESKLVIVYTGKPHFSGDANRLAIENLKKGKNVKNLLRLRDIAREMKNCLLREDLERFAELMNEETEQRDDLHKVTVPLGMEKTIKKAMSHGAIASKVCGSGAGGSILFFGDKKRLKKKFGRKVIDFKFDFKGLRWL
jgi:D-glycero-alpha-D-manno-heptose-7-phosphate kinase